MQPIDYSDAGFAIVIAEDPTWAVEVAGRPVDLVRAGDVAAGLAMGSFFDPPPVDVIDGGSATG